MAGAISWYISSLKTWLMGTHHGAGADHLNAYLDEFVFRCNRRHNRVAGFASLLGFATEVGHATAAVTSPFSATAKRRGGPTGQTGVVHRNPPPRADGDAPRRRRAAARQGVGAPGRALTRPARTARIAPTPVLLGGFEMRAIGLLLGAAILVTGCSPSWQPPTSADTQFSVVVYNRTQGPAFALAHEVAACASSRMPFAETTADATPPPGAATVGAIKITTPRGYAGIVSVVITAGGASSVTVGDIPESSLPACQGTP